MLKRISVEPCKEWDVISPYRKRTEAVHNRSANHATSLYPKRSAITLHGSYRATSVDQRAIMAQFDKRARAIKCMKEMKK